MYVFVPPPPPSPEAQDLGAKVAQLVRMLKEENPDLSATDIRRGLEIARSHLRPEIGGLSPQLVATILLLILGVAAFVGVYVYRSGFPPMVLMIAIGIAAAGLGLVAVAAAARR